MTLWAVLPAERFQLKTIWTQLGMTTGPPSAPGSERRFIAANCCSWSRRMTGIAGLLYITPPRRLSAVLPGERVLLPTGSVGLDAPRDVLHQLDHVQPYSALQACCDAAQAHLTDRKVSLDLLRIGPEMKRFASTIPHIHP